MLVCWDVWTIGQNMHLICQSLFFTMLVCLSQKTNFNLSSLKNACSRGLCSGINHLRLVIFDFDLRHMHSAVPTYLLCCNISHFDLSKWLWGSSKCIFESPASGNVINLQGISKRRAQKSSRQRALQNDPYRRGTDKGHFPEVRPCYSS